MPLYTFIHNLLNVLVQIANKWDYKKKKTLVPLETRNPYIVTSVMECSTSISTFGRILNNAFFSYSVLCRTIAAYFHRFTQLARPPLCSSGQSSWLQIRRPGFDSRHYQEKKVVGLERGPPSLVSTTEELIDRKSSGSCLENREYGRRDPSR
jgi:hypothetical protein